MSTLVKTLHLPYSLTLGILPGIFTLSRVEFAFICSRCGCVKGICEAVSSLLGHETHETRREVKTGKFPLGKK